MWTMTSTANEDERIFILVQALSTELLLSSTAVAGRVESWNGIYARHRLQPDSELVALWLRLVALVSYLHVLDRL